MVQPLTWCFYAKIGAVILNRTQSSPTGVQIRGAKRGKHTTSRHKYTDVKSRNANVKSQYTDVKYRNTDVKTNFTEVKRPRCARAGERAQKARRWSKTEPPSARTEALAQRGRTAALGGGDLRKRTTPKSARTQARAQRGRFTSYKYLLII